MYDMILVRYGEMTLKKKNYKTFLNKINDNIKSCVHSYNNSYVVLFSHETSLLNV